MSANNAEPTGEVKDNPDEPISGQNGVDYDSYASGGDTAKSNGEGINFDSQDLKKRQKTEYFVNIEGAEKIKREEERRQAEEEKRRFAELNRMDAEMRNNSIQPQQHNGHSEEVELRKITKQQKKREKNAARRTRNARISANLKAATSTTCKKLFGGKKKFIWLGAVLIAMLAGGGALFYQNIIEPARIAEIKKTTKENAYVGTEEANEAEVIIEKVNDMSFTGASVDERLKYVQDSINTMKTDGGKQTIQILYWRIYGYEKNTDEAIRELDKIQSSTKYSYIKYDAFDTMSQLYSIIGDDSKSEEYSKKAQEYN